MGGKKTPKDLAKLLAYVLGRRPDEWALVPDRNGYVAIKSLLQALGEEKGWGYVRRSHIHEILLSLPDAPVEMDGERIRAVDRNHLPRPEPAPDPPGLLYHCIRRRAWPHAHEKGLAPALDESLCLTEDKETALRRGRRMDPDPVLITVHTGLAQDRGTVFSRFGQGLFLAGQIAPECLSGPPLPQSVGEPARGKKKPPPEPPVERTPGGFFLDPTRKPGAVKGPKGRKKDPEWKRERRRRSRQS